jgi:ligand-binding sensor domain-containing protein
MFFRFPVAYSLIIFILWTYSTSQVVNRLSGDRFTHYRYDDWLSYATALDITSIDIDESYIYFGSLGGGILRYDKYENHWEYPFTSSNGLRSNIINEVVYNPQDGFLYASTPAGIDVYKPAEKFWQPSGSTRMPPHRQSQQSLNSAITPRDNQRFPPYSRPSNNQLPDFFTDITLTYQLGGGLLDQYNREFRLTDRIVDSWQRVWFGTNGLGPLMADLFHVWLEPESQSIPHIAPRDVFVTEDFMWIGGLQNGSEIAGITYWDRRNDHWTYYEAQFIPQLYKDDVYAIAANDRYALFATIHGLAVYNRKKDIWKTLSIQHGLNGDKVFDVQLSGNTAYVGTEFGFNWVDLTSMKVYESPETTLDNVHIYQLAVDTPVVWAATRFGLYSINMKNEKIEFYEVRAGIIDYDMRAVEKFGTQIWVATDAGKIAYWDQKKDEWHSYPDLILQQKYTFQPHIRDIATTQNAVWFATDKGLLKYDTKRNYWRIFTEEDGLISDNTFHVDPEGNYLWISCDAGITRFRWKSKRRID